MTRAETQAARMARMEEQIAGLSKQVAASNDATAEALREIKALREDHRKEMQALTDKHNALDRAFAEARGTVRGVKIGWAAAFAAIGGGIVAIAAKVSELFS